MEAKYSVLIILLFSLNLVSSDIIQISNSNEHLIIGNQYIDSFFFDESLVSNNVSNITSSSGGGGSFSYIGGNFSTPINVPKKIVFSWLFYILLIMIIAMIFLILILITLSSFKKVKILLKTQKA